MPTEKTQKKNKNNSKHQKNKQPSNNTTKKGRVISWSIPQRRYLKKGDSIVYHPWYHPRDWNGGQTKQSKNRQQSQKPPHPRAASKLQRIKGQQPQVLKADRQVWVFLSQNVPDIRPAAKRLETFGQRVGRGTLGL